ncbi:MAG: hypothetical protein LUD47_00345 [Clostridia bacterium]|nr:hypothetical protein [Clostridia bacterium]
MRITKLDLMRLASTFDGEIEFEDLTEEDLKEIFGCLPDDATIGEIRDRYFEFYDDVKDKTQPFHKWSD